VAKRCTSTTRLTALNLSGVVDVRLNGRFRQVCLSE
jgi:hypothetical protein